MATRVGCGISYHRDPKAAAHEAVAQAVEQSGDTHPDLVMVFATVGYDQRLVVKAVREETGGSPLVGCSGEGVIVGNVPDESNFALAVLTLSSDEIRFQTGVAVGLQDDAEGVGEAIAKAIQPSRLPDAKALLLFADGLTMDFDGLLVGIEQGLGLDELLPILGATAADNWQWGMTYQYCDDEVVVDAAVWALLSGDIRLATAVNHGCVPMGMTHEVTRSEGTRIYELDGRPALDVIAEYLAKDEINDWASVTINLPLGFEAPSELAGYDEDDFIIRILLLKDDDDGSVTVPTRVATGSRLSIHRRDLDKTINGVEGLADTLLSQLGDETPQLVLQFECAGRGKSFLRDVQKQDLIQKLRDRLPDAPWFGFYTYGEIGPVSGQNTFHNYTAVLAALY